MNIRALGHGAKGGVSHMSIKKLVGNSNYMGPRVEGEPIKGCLEKSKFNSLKISFLHQD